MRSEDDRGRSGRSPSVPPEACRRTPVDQAKKEAMLAVFLRNPEAFETVQDTFRVRDCRRSLGDHLAVVWEVARRFYRRYGDLPGRAQLEAEVRAALRADPSLLSDEEAAEVERFLAYVWDDAAHGKGVATSRTALRAAVDTCREVMEEVVAADLSEKISRAGTVPADLPALLQTGQQRLEVVRSISEFELEEPFPEGWDRRGDNRLVPTGVAALDALTGGGLMAGECLLFLAPYGSCKTATACDSTAALVEYAAGLYASGESLRAEDGSLRVPVVVLAFTESDKDEYRNRLMARLARVPWRRLRQMRSLADLDDGDRPGATEATRYELEEFAEALACDRKNLVWENEQQRVRRAMAVANRHLLLVDCTDTDDKAYRIGAGGMAEVANVVRGVFRRKRTHYPVFVWVDHLSGLVDRMGDAVRDEAELRRVLTNMPRLAVERIGRHFRCPVGLMHQFSGASQNKGVVARFHHSDAEGSKSVGKYANFCVVSGKTDANLMCVWEATKHRREPPTAERIVRVDGDFSRLVDCTATHSIERGRNVILAKAELDAVTLFRRAAKGGDLNSVVDV